MKKFCSILTVVALVLTLFAGCAQNTPATPDEPSEQSQNSQTPADSDKKVRIGIVQPMEHPSLNQIREYIIKGLDELGMSDRVEIVYKNGQSDPSNINTIVSQFVGENMDIIVPIATAPAQSAAAATKTIPIVFAAVSYPVQAGLVTSLDKTDGNITGVSNAIAIEDIFDLAKTLTPDVKTFGFIYNSGEVNSVSGIDRAKAYCDANGLKYVEATITNSGDILQATQSLIGKKVDAIFTPNDNTVATAMPVLSSEAIKAKIPVYVGADSLVQDGGLATVGIDYTILGRQVAQMLKRIIDGQTIAENPVEVVSEYAKIVNTTTAEAIGVEIPDELLKTFKTME